LHNLDKIDVPVLSINYLYTARKTGSLIKLPEMIANGQLSSALLIECSRLYMASDQELVAQIVLDVKKELFN
jgi:hypothetical protein